VPEIVTDDERAIDVLHFFYDVCHHYIYRKRTLIPFHMSNSEGLLLKNLFVAAFLRQMCAITDQISEMHKMKE